MKRSVDISYFLFQRCMPCLQLGAYVLYPCNASAADLSVIELRKGLLHRSIVLNQDITKRRRLLASKVMRHDCYRFKK